MKLHLMVCAFVVASGCHAQENALKASVGLLKDSLPDDVEFSFSKSRIRFDGCKHREYQLSLVKPVNDALSFEANLTHAKGKLDWGVYTQSVTVMRYSLMPTYTLNEQWLLGAGITYQSSPEFRTSHNGDFDLPEHTTLFIKTRLTGFRNNHHVEFELSQARWQATDLDGNWFEQGKTDSKITLSYEANF